MKTHLALLITTEGRTTMTHVELAKLRSKAPRTLLNEISAKKCPVPMWKDGDAWVCHVADVATWIDQQRNEAIKANPNWGGFELVGVK